jgi:hypothetical protein
LVTRTRWSPATSGCSIGGRPHGLAVDDDGRSRGGAVDDEDGWAGAHRVELGAHQGALRGDLVADFVEAADVAALVAAGDDLAALGVDELERDFIVPVLHGDLGADEVAGVEGGPELVVADLAVTGVIGARLDVALRQHGEIAALEAAPQASGEGVAGVTAERPLHLER